MSIVESSISAADGTHEPQHIGHTTSSVDVAPLPSDDLPLCATIQALDDTQAQRPVVIDARERSSYADFLIIASGTSDRHVQAIAEKARTALQKSGEIILGAEGLREGQWALVDSGRIVVHVFHQYMRDIYNLEQMWQEAPRLQASLESHPNKA